MYTHIVIVVIVIIVIIVILTILIHNNDNNVYYCYHEGSCVGREPGQAAGRERLGPWENVKGGDEKGGMQFQCKFG